MGREKERNEEQNYEYSKVKCYGTVLPGRSGEVSRGMLILYCFCLVFLENICP